MAFAYEVFPLLIKPTWKDKLIFKELALKRDDSVFWWISGSSGVFLKKVNFFKGPCLIVSGQPDTNRAFNCTLTYLFYCLDGAFP